MKNLNKKRIILGFILSIGCFAACYLFSGSFLKSAVLASCFAIIGCIQIRIPAVFCVPVTLASFFITGAGSLFLSQFVQNEGFASLIGNAALEGLCCCTFFTCILYVIFPSIRFSTIGVAGITLFLSTANWFVYHFRGSEIVPIDLISLGTAMNVANQYNFTITANIVYSWVLFALVSFAVFSIQIPSMARKSRSYILTLFCTIAIGLCFVNMTKNSIAIHFGNGGTYYKGYILNFTLSMKELFVKKPDGYSKESVKQIISEYSDTGNSTMQSQYPDIIVIMDEAYSDLSVLGSNFHTSEPVSPFIQSLNENTVRGYALSSAYGGRTANSEFEFLTSATLSFTPPGTIGYQQYIDEQAYSLTSILKSRGYNTIAMHPFLSNGWKRNTVWPRLGFSECYFLEDFPQKN